MPIDTDWMLSQSLPEPVGTPGGSPPTPKTKKSLVRRIFGSSPLTESGLGMKNGRISLVEARSPNIPNLVKYNPLLAPFVLPFARGAAQQGLQREQLEVEAMMMQQKMDQEKAQTAHIQAVTAELTNPSVNSTYSKELNAFVTVRRRPAPGENPVEIWPLKKIDQETINGAINHLESFWPAELRNDPIATGQMATAAVAAFESGNPALVPEASQKILDGYSEFRRKVELAERKPDTSVSEAELALRAASGDKQAAVALELLREQKKAGRAVTAEGGKYLTPSEAALLGVPYGTTREAAKGRLPANESQKITANYATRLKQSGDVIDSLGPKITKIGYLGQTYEKYAPNLLKTDIGRSFMQAKRNFINAVLRRESGAVISPSEFKEGDKQYFPQPGDDPTTLEQKRQNRAVVIENFKRASGNAYLDPGTLTKPNWGDQPQTLVGPGGKTLTLGPDGKYH